MPTVIVNDEVLEYEVGEELLDVARRNSAHIGFLCSGKGICQTCTCRVLEGQQHLSPPNELEQTLISEARLEQNYRLACQTKLQGTGSVKILSRAEEIRRLALGVIQPPPGTNPGENLGRFLNRLTGVLPSNLPRTLSRLAKIQISPNGLQHWTSDLGHVVDHMLNVDPTTALPVPSEQSKLTKR